MRAGKESMQRMEVSWELLGEVGLENRKGMLKVKSGGMLPQAKEPPEAGREVRTFLGAFRGSTALPTH